MREASVERRLEGIEERIDALARELGEVQRRLQALEVRRGDAAVEPAATPPAGSAARRVSAIRPSIPSRTIALVGRTLVVLGGAFLLRAISEAEVIPALAAAGASLAYATGWLVQADRSAARGQRESAVFHGIAAAVIAFPLIWETTARYELMAPTVAAAALVAFLGFGLAVAWRRELWEIAWTVTLLAVATTLGLLVATHAFLPLGIASVLIAVAVESLAFRERWLSLRWPAALALDVAVLMTITVALSPEPASAVRGGVSPASAIGVGLALPLLYLSSIGARTLLRERVVTPFEMIQVAVALVAGIGGVVRVIAFTGGEPTALAAGSVLLGAACYAAAFAFIDRRSRLGPNFYAYTTLGGLLILTGSWMILDGAALAVAWSILAVASVGLGTRFDRITLRFHGAVYVAAAATAAGLVACASDGLLGDAAAALRPVTPFDVGMTVVLAACYAVLVRGRRTPTSRWPERLPQAIIGAVGVWSVAGMAAGWLAGSLVTSLAATGAAPNVAFVAAGRTAVLAILVVALAWGGRRWLLEELTWFVYLLLIGAGLKLLWEDLRHGEPLALFIALSFYGGALIVTPRLMRRGT